MAITSAIGDNADMPQDFSVVSERTESRPARQRVLVTGAAGHIGGYFAEHNSDRYALRLMIRPGEDGSALAGRGEMVEVDLADLPGMTRAMQQIETVVHMAGNPSPSAVWADLLQNNIVGAYNMFVAARAAGVRRVIYASSIHAVSGYPCDVQVKTNEPVNPGDLYGVSKCFGEALGRYMAEQEGLSVICLRIGGHLPPETMCQPATLPLLDAWVSRRDLDQLIRRCIDVPNLRFAIFHGLSDNRFKRLDISSARELIGYAPQDDATAVSGPIRDLHLNEKLAGHNLTGDGTQSGIRSDLARARG